MSRDVILAGGSVVDGTGAPAYRADVVISDGRITAIDSSARKHAIGDVVDVGGLVVCPGFIDMHSHSDLALLADPAHEAKVWQGVTTEVLGQDGLSYAPVTDETMAALVTQLAGWNGTPGLEYDWRTVAEYLDRIDAGAATNAAYLVPHGTVRYAVVGADNRTATEAEMREMIVLVAEGMRDGAMGLSSGLTYTPGMYADDDELVALCAPVRDAGGYYCPHHRNYGARVVEAYADCITIARRARVALHLAHCHVNFPQNAGRAHEVLAAIDAAIDDDIDVSLDTYPYLAGATYLAALLPSWAHAGGTEATLRRLANAEERRRILHEIEVTGSDGQHGIPVDWTTIVVTGVADPAHDWAVGESIAALAQVRDTTPGQLYCDLLVADRLAPGCLVEVGNEDNVRTIMKHRAHTGSTDGLLVGARPHPRGWGTFPRYLGTYVRELGVLGLEECVEHLTSRAARRLGLTDRGVVREGAVADIAVFDADNIAATATYEDPKRQPAGVHHVLVNGEFTLREGRRTDALPGRSVRATRRKERARV